MSDTKARVFRGWGVGNPGSPHAGRAALRDASWFSSPGRAGRYHIVSDDGGSACSGMPLILDEGGAGGEALKDMTVDPVSVESWLRCQRPGCKQRWP